MLSPPYAGCCLALSALSCSQQEMLLYAAAGTLCLRHSHSSELCSIAFTLALLLPQSVIKEDFQQRPCPQVSFNSQFAHQVKSLLCNRQVGSCNAALSEQMSYSCRSLGRGSLFFCSLFTDHLSVLYSADLQGLDRAFCVQDIHHSTRGCPEAHGSAR